MTIQYMNIQTYPIGEMQSNCYLLEKEGQALLIDPGDSADFLLEKIQIQRLELVGIVATHGHFDHIMAVGEIQMSYPELPLFIHEDDTFLLERVVETARHFLGYDPVIIPIESTKHMKPGKLSIHDFEFTIIETPGHTPGSCCLHFERENALFSGDTLFKSGIGRYDFSYSDKEDLKKSLERILELPKITTVYPGHGEETSIDEEKNIIEQFF